MVLKEQRRLRRIARRKVDILAAAKAILLEEDYKSVTMERLALVADVSKATLYLYFKSKADVYHGILLSDMEVLVKLIRESTRKSSHQAQTLKLMADAYAQFFSSHVEYFSRLSFYYYPGRFEKLDPRVAREILDQIVNALEMIEGVIASGVEVGEFKTRNAWVSAVALWAFWEGAVQTVATGRTERFGLDLKSIIEAGMETYIQGFRSSSEFRNSCETLSSRSGVK